MPSAPFVFKVNNAQKKENKESKMHPVVSARTEKFFSNFVRNHINSPEQRLLQGAVALAWQPFVEYNNTKTTDETRAVSTAKTIGKVVAGTLTGFAVRKGSISLVTKVAQRLSVKDMARLKGFTKLKVLLTPDLSKVSKNLKKGDIDAQYKNYINTMGTILATGAMVFTNFLIDAPLTKFIMEKLTPVFRNKIQNEQQGALNVSS